MLIFYWLYFDKCTPTQKIFSIRTSFLRFIARSTKQTYPSALYYCSINICSLERSDLWKYNNDYPPVTQWYRGDLSFHTNIRYGATPAHSCLHVTVGTADSNLRMKVILVLTLCVFSVYGKILRKYILFRLIRIHHHINFHFISLL